VNATHIIGGEIVYTLLDANQNRYRITVQLFFDCQNGDEGAIESDDQIIISQWNAATSTYIGDFEMSKTSSKNIRENTSYNCVKNPGNVCVTASVYSAIRVINPGNNGVILSWQRCCRNNKIDNINNPGGSGFTAWTKIPPESTTNSSPYFTDILPIYICVDAPLSIDLTAVDLDGDSLVYGLSTPYLGGADNPANRRRPDEQSEYEAPPFRTAIWKNSFNVQNQIPGSPSLNINSRTGEMTVTPSQVGEFSIGITVKEYRNGTLIGQTSRDYQISVINCQFDILANYTIPNGTTVGGAYSFECGDTVKVINTSIVKPGLKATFFWDFGDPTTTDDTLTTYDKAVPVEYIYPGNGDYTITLTVTSDICNDEYKYNVRIRSSKSFELGEDIIFCNDFIQVLDTKTPDALSVTWSDGQTGSSITVDQVGIYIAEVSYGKCSYKDTITLSSDPVPAFSLLPDTLVCDNIDFVLDVGVPDLSYQWNTEPPQSTRSIRITDTGSFAVIVRNLNCFARDTTRVWQPTKPILDDAFYCDEFSHDVDVGDIEEGEYLWSNNVTTPATTITEGGVQWVRVTQRHCVNSDSFSITNPVINLELGEDTHFCDKLDITLDAGPDGDTYNWSTGADSRSIRVTSPGIYKVTVVDRFGCESKDSVNLSLSNSPTFDLGDDTTICLNSPTLLSGPEGFADYEWSTGEISRQILAALDGIYSLKITDEYKCFGADSLLLTVDPEALPNELYLPNAFTPNQDGLNELFPYKKSVSQPGYFITIYSRWGEKVFDSRESNVTSWDGYYKGARVPVVPHIYNIYYRGCDGTAKNARGSVTPLY